MKTLTIGMLTASLVIGAWAVNATVEALSQAAQVMQLANR